MKTIFATTALAATLIGASFTTASATVVIRDGGLLDVQAQSYGVDHEGPTAAGIAASGPRPAAPSAACRTRTDPYRRI